MIGEPQGGVPCVEMPTIPAAEEATAKAAAPVDLWDTSLAYRRLEAYEAALQSYGLSTFDIDDVNKYLANVEKAADAALAYARRS